MLVGLLLFVDYLLVAILVSVELTLPGRIAFALGVASLLAFTVGEALYAVRPTESRLRRADRLALPAVGVCALIVLAVIVVDLAVGQLLG